MKDLPSPSAVAAMQSPGVTYVFTRLIASLLSRRGRDTLAQLSEGEVPAADPL
jgi:hypothetical protein